MKTWIILPFLFVLAFSVDVSAQFLEIKGMPGSSADPKHRGWIELNSFSMSNSRPTSTNSSTRQRGSANFTPVNVTKFIDKSSPKLMEAVANGRVFPTMTIDLVDNRKNVYVKITLSNVMITSYQVSGSKKERPTEEFSLNYEHIKYSYLPSKVDFNWNTKTNRPK